MNGGILPSGLFWTVALPPGSFSFSANGKNAYLSAHRVPLVDTFALFGTPSPLGTMEAPACVDIDAKWRATGPAVARGAGTGGTLAEAFLGEFAPALATGKVAGSEIGFSFSTPNTATTQTSYAEIGRERNGVFL